MNKIMLKLFFLTCLLSLSTQSYAVQPGDKLKPLQPIVSITKGFELVPLQLNRGLDGMLKYVKVQACDNCAILSLKVDQNTLFYRDGEALSLQEVSKLNEQTADIIFDPQKQHLLEVNFHIMEGAS